MPHHLKTVEQQDPDNGFVRFRCMYFADIIKTAGAAICNREDVKVTLTVT